MSYLPALRGKSQNKFTNPLSGFVYDNKKYAESCFPDGIATGIPRLREGSVASGGGSRSERSDCGLIHANPVDLVGP